MEDHHNAQDEEKNLALRLAGQLPTLDIAGDMFWVDLEKNCLRPKGPFIPKEISFNSLESYFSWTQDKYVFTYNRLHHEPQEVAISDLYHMPNSIHLVEFPSMERLDPVGYARLHQEDITYYVKQLGMDLHHKANTIALKPTLSKLLRQQKPSRFRAQHTFLQASENLGVSQGKGLRIGRGRKL
ncbi:hypothetical protein SAMN04487891_102385 [Flagellimonas taeanensis]|uniref:Uncharacterized protein n=1 Tax=Flagellimonas taeanensis TaxID=1005926 RepID=A0A1M6SBB4_9FLAO|nr:hypothetical protein [Allomuricauda taeanensis]SFB79688.1 hypothetical protein SAMN04487891_102385 [Allomuricauda taeanensis]SHK41996.1 hypothetical protein SAMN05216293_1064 [Allomuricauda taeanensis]